MENLTTNQPLIIGLTIGAVVLAIIIVICVICCCCRKAERSCLKRSLKRLDRQQQQAKKDLTVEQQRRKEEMTQRHNDIRNKYGLNNYNQDIQPSRDNIFSVENERVSLSFKK